MKLVRHFHFRVELFHVLPLVNVLFLALLLFALSARFTLQPGLSLSLPTSPFTLAPQQNPLVLSITAAPLPTLYLSEERVTLEGLDVALQDRQLAGRPLIIRADRATPRGDTSTSSTPLRANAPVVGKVNHDEKLPSEYAIRRPR